ncbi:restriction endonuclease [Sphingobacterium faecium]|uniref:restriction endonuclease n=1 Tax=Sphingobacterium faecium TaxID=34087 RepID=UPI00247A323B|nr:restriction endonuclease [Sphingobacterium faecium]WGQ16907.1 restriction endonuclease [Sphingobacterium faecium]
MIFHESEIEFDRLDWKQFEELCYDILVKFNFHTMSWRQGGTDNGRDIEARRYITDSIVSPYEEKWFIECKRYSSGLSLDQIVEKINWARVEKADHFLLIVSSYITTSAREWLIKAQDTENFKIHIIEGKFLKHRLLLFPDLINKYFADDHVRLVRSLMRQWISHHILPSPKALYDLYENLDFGKLDYQELGFIWHAYFISQDALDQYYIDEDLIPIQSKENFPFDFLVPHLKIAQNWEYPVMKEFETEKFFGVMNPLGHACMEPKNYDDFCFSNIHYELSNGERIQVCLIKENKILEVRIGVGKKL